MTSRQALVLSLSEIAQDPRIRRVCRSLIKTGFEVTALCPMTGGTAQSAIDGFQIIRVPIPTVLTDAVLSEFYASDANIADVIEQCDPLALSGFSPSIADFHAKRISRFVHRKAYQLTNPGRTNPRLLDRLAVRGILLANLELYKAARSLNGSLVIANDLDTLIAGCMLKSSLQSPLVYDAHEIYAEQLPEHLRTRYWHDFFTQLERQLIVRTDMVATVCDSIGLYFESMYSVRDVVTVRNCPEKKFLHEHDVAREAHDPVKVLYHGVYAPFRGLDEVVEAAREVAAHFVFRGIGDYQHVLKARVKEYRLEKRVEFAAPVSVDQLVSEAAQADIGLSPFISVCKNTEFTLPNKYFEYMFAGLCLVSSDLVEMRKVTKEYCVGQVYDSVHPEELVVTLNQLIADRERLQEFKNNSLKAARERFFWEYDERLLLQRIEALL